jgi:hypothetical protein
MKPELCSGIESSETPSSERMKMYVTKPKQEFVWKGNILLSSCLGAG